MTQSVPTRQERKQTADRGECRAARRYEKGLEERRRGEGAGGRRHRRRRRRRRRRRGSSSRDQSLEFSDSRRRLNHTATTVAAVDQLAGRPASQLAGQVEPPRSRTLPGAATTATIRKGSQQRSALRSCQATTTSRACLINRSPATKDIVEPGVLRSTTTPLRHTRGFTPLTFRRPRRRQSLNELKNTYETVLSHTISSYRALILRRNRDKIRMAVIKDD